MTKPAPYAKWSKEVRHARSKVQDAMVILSGVDDPLKSMSFDTVLSSMERKLDQYAKQLDERRKQSTRRRSSSS